MQLDTTLALLVALVALGALVVLSPRSRGPGETTDPADDDPDIHAR